MTNLQVREYLEGGGRTVLVPVGSTEDHGDHGPLWTDVYIPIEVCKRAARGARRARRAAGAVRARARPPRRERHRLRPPRDVHLAAARHLRLARRGGLRADRARQRPLRATRSAMQFAAARDPRPAATGNPRLPVPVLAGPAAGGGGAVPLGQRRAPRERGETSVVLAIDQDLVDMERVRDFVPSWRASRTIRSRCSTPYSSRRPARSGRSSRRAEASGATPSESTAEKGEQFLRWGAASVVDLVRDIEDVHDRIEPGYSVSAADARGHRRDPRRRLHGVGPRRRTTPRSATASA